LFFLGHKGASDEEKKRFNATEQKNPSKGEVVGQKGTMAFKPFAIREKKKEKGERHPPAFFHNRGRKEFARGYEKTHEDREGEKREVHAATKKGGTPLRETPLLWGGEELAFLIGEKSTALPRWR